MQYMRFYSNIWSTKTFKVLVALWFFLIIYCEYITYSVTIAGCSYPTFPNAEDVNEANIYHVLLVSDPQLISKHSYDRGFLLDNFVIFLSDLYMKISFHFITKYHTPDAVFYLGDLLENTPVLSQAEYKEHIERFRWVFATADTEPPPSTLAKRDAIVSSNSNFFHPKINYLSPYHSDVNNRLPAFFHLGNHDVGMYKGPSHLIEWYKAMFGPLNYQVSIGNFTFVIVSTTLLEDVKYYYEESKMTRGFVNKYITDTSMIPRILISHIPLYRKREETCGEFHRKQIKDQMGKTYLNMVSSYDSQFLIDMINPIYTFSGDDHDFCSVTHNLRHPELTVATFSFTEGSSAPGYVLLTLYNPDCTASVCRSEPVFKVQPCYLPPRIYLYAAYGVFLVNTVLLLVGIVIRDVNLIKIGNAKRGRGRETEALLLMTRKVWDYLWRLVAVCVPFWLLVLTFVKNL